MYANQGCATTQHSRFGAVGIKSGRAGVAGTISFTSGLDPDDSINVRGRSGGGRPWSESSSLDVAPVSPGLTDVLDTGTALVDDEVGREGAQERTQSFHVVLLVVVAVSRGDWVRGRGTIRGQVSVCFGSEKQCRAAYTSAL